MRIMVLALALLASVANGVTIWGSTSRSPAGGTERIPVDTSSSSAPGHLTVANIGTWVWANPSATLGRANGGTGLTSASDDTVLLSNGTTWAASAVPNCVDTGGNHLNYTAASNAFSCGTSGAGGGSGTVTSVDVSGGSTGLSFSGGPVTTAGTITAAGTLALGSGGTGAALADPNADRLMFWDDSAAATAYGKPGSGLSVSGTTFSAVSGLGGFYGDGSAGDLTSSSGVTTVSANNQVQYDDVTLTSTATVYTSGRVLYIDVLDLSAAPARAVNVDGGAASGTTAGTSLADTGRQTPAVGTSGNAGASATGGGTSSATLTAGRIVLTADVVSYSSAGRGGNGGSGAGGSGGTAGAMPDALTAGQLLASIPTQPETVTAWLRTTATSISTPGTQYHGYVNNGATGGAGGGGNGSQLGTAGGGGGGTAGPLIVYARHIIVSASTPACVLSASGGLGATSTNSVNNNTGTGGGGGGGQGGLVIVVTDSVTATDATTSVADAICADGAAGGSAGTPMGTGVAGVGGYSGRGGRVILWNRGLGTTSYAGPTAGNAPSGATGGTIAQARADLVVN